MLGTKQLNVSEMVVKDFAFVVILLVIRFSVVASQKVTTEIVLVQPFTIQGEPVNAYPEIIKSLQPGSRVAFPDGSIIGIKSILGAGSNEIIFETNSGEALRLRQNSRSIMGDTLELFYQGIRALAEASIPTPRIYKYEKGQYLLVERIMTEGRDSANKFTLENFLLGNVNVEYATERKAIRALTQFSRLISSFKIIDDFHAGQIVFDGTQWIILDASAHHQYWNKNDNLNEKHPWQQVSWSEYAKKSSRSAEFVMVIRNQVQKTLLTARITKLASHCSSLVR